MAEPAAFDAKAAHTHFSVACFNMAWTLIDKPSRTAEENEQMIRLAHTSLWHWTQRDDCTRRNLAIGFWQLSRVYALADQAGEATRYGRARLEHSREEGPFYLGYAFEALARAAMVGGDRETMDEYLSRARRLAEAVAEPDEKALLLQDLDTIQL